MWPPATGGAVSCARRWPCRSPRASRGPPISAWRSSCSRTSWFGCMPWKAPSRGTRGSTTAATGTSSSYPACRCLPASRSAQRSTSTRCRPRTRRTRYAKPLLAVQSRRLRRPKGPSRLDCRAEVQALVLGLLDQHHGLERVHVVDALLLPLGGNLGLVGPVIQLHLRDPRDLADLAQVELDLVEMLGNVDRLQEFSRLVVHHGLPPARNVACVESYTGLVPV